MEYIGAPTTTAALAGLWKILFAAAQALETAYGAGAMQWSPAPGVWDYSEYHGYGGHYASIDAEAHVDAARAAYEAARHWPGNTGWSQGKQANVAGYRVPKERPPEPSATHGTGGQPPAAHLPEAASKTDDNGYMDEDVQKWWQATQDDEYPPVRDTVLEAHRVSGGAPRTATQDMRRRLAEFDEARATQGVCGTRPRMGLRWQKAQVGPQACQWTPSGPKHNFHLLERAEDDQIELHSEASTGAAADAAAEVRQRATQRARTAPPLHKKERKKGVEDVLPWSGLCPPPPQQTNDGLKTTYTTGKPDALLDWYNSDVAGTKSTKQKGRAEGVYYPGSGHCPPAPPGIPQQAATHVRVGPFQFLCKCKEDMQWRRLPKEQEFVCDECGEDIRRGAKGLDCRTCDTTICAACFYDLAGRRTRGRSTGGLGDGLPDRPGRALKPRLPAGAPPRQS